MFVRKNGLEGEKIKISNMAPNLQEPMLIKGDIDAALVFNITSYFNLVLNRQDPDKDYKWFSFGDYGMDLYSNGVMVSKKLLASNPKAVAGLVRAVNKGMIAVAKDQNAGMKAAMNFDNLINVEVEKRRLQFSFDKLIVSPEMKEIGVGDIKDDRMARAIGIIVEGYQLARAPTPSEIFSPRIPAAARRARTGLYRRTEAMMRQLAGHGDGRSRQTSLFCWPRPRHARQRRAAARQRRHHLDCEAARPAAGPRSFVLPAFVNAHDHARPTASSFGALGMPLESWILRSALGTPVDPYLTAASALARSARAGCAAMMVHYTRPSGTMPLVEEAKAIARAAADVGIRIAFAIAVRDQNPIVYGDSEPVLSSLSGEDRKTIEELFVRPAMPPKAYIELTDAIAAAIAGPEDRRAVRPRRRAVVLEAAARSDRREFGARPAAASTCICWKPSISAPGPTRISRKASSAISATSASCRSG